MCAALTACTAEGGARVAADTPLPTAKPGHRAGTAPDQRWGSAAGQRDLVDGPKNRTVPTSLRARYPLAAPAATKTKPSGPLNKAQVVQAAPPTSKAPGFDPATSRELPTARAAHHRTYANADGTETTAFSATPMNYRRVDGSWAPVDPTLVPEGAGGWRTAAGSVPLRVAARADATELAHLAFDDKHSMAYGLAGARNVAGETAADTTIYRDVQRNVDLELQAQSGAVRDTLVLRSADAPHRFVFPLRLSGLTAAMTDGEVSLTDAAGARRATIPATTMVDADDASTGNVTYRLVSAGGVQALEVSLDSAWLRESARSFPVRVGPPVDFAAADSSLVVQGGSTRSGSSELLIGKQDGAAAATSYLKFTNLVERLQHHQIYGAGLQVVNFDSPTCSPRRVNVHPVTESWPGGSDGPATGPAMAGESFAYGHVALGQTASSCPAAATLIELGTKGRDLIQGWVNGKPNNGLALRASAADSKAWKRFTGTGTKNPPLLHVTHSPYHARYAIPKPVPDPAVLQNQDGKVKVTVTNLGAEAWKPGAYYLAYRAYNVSTGKAAGQHRAADLTTTVARNGRVTFDATIKRMTPGRYFLDFTMVKSAGPVFSDMQVPPGRIVLEVFDIPPVINQLHPPNGYANPTLTPQLWAWATDPDAPPGSALRFKFEYCELTPAGARTGCADSGYQTDQAWTIPAGKLAWSKVYQWRAGVKDGTNEVFYGWQTLRSSVPQPEITSRIANAPYGSQDRDFDPQVGNLTNAAVDAAVSNVGPPLRVVRTYNSLDPRRDLMFGAGWTTQFDMRLIPDDDGSGNVVITYPDGQQVRFGRNPDGTFAAPAGRTAQLTVVGTVYRLLDRAGASYEFSAGGSGALLRITDAMGRHIRLTYQSDRLARARVEYTNDATYGRAFTFGWTGNRVTSVSTDPVNGRSLVWTYAYTGDLLTKACAPGGAICTTYTYAPGSHYRTAVLDSDPDSYWRLGEAEGGSAGSEMMNNLGKDAGTITNVTLGVPGALAGTENTAATFNGTSSMVDLPKGMVKKNRDGAVELWFKVSVSQTGGPLIGYQDTGMNATATKGAPLVYVGLDGRVYGQFRTGTVKPITGTRDVRDNKWHHVVLSAMGNVQTLYLDGAKVGSLDGAIDHSALTVNQLGAAQATTPASWPQWGASAKRFFSGSLDEVAVYARPMSALAVKAHYALAAQADQLATVILPSGKVSSEAVYDTDLDRIKEYTDGNGGTWKIGAPAVYGGDRDLRRTIQVLDPADRPHLYEYDALAGRMLRSGTPMGLGTREEDRPDYRDPTPTPAPSPTELCTTPDPGDPRFCTTIPGSAGGPVFEGRTLEGMIIRSFGYNDKGFQNEITNENGDKLTLEFDDRGNVTSRKTCRTATECYTSYTTYRSTVTNQFDPVNDLPLETRDGRSASATDAKYLTSYKYNAAGNLMSQTSPDGSMVQHKYTSFMLDGVPTGLVYQTTDTRSAVTKYQYNKYGDLTLVTTPSGLRTEYTYDELGRRVSEKEISDTYPAGVVTTFGYDDLNRLVRTTGPVTTDAVNGTKHQTVTTTTYDNDSNVVSEEVRDVLTDAPARVSTTEYDEFNRAVRNVDAEGNEQSQGYDRFGNRVWLTDANHNRYEYAYTSRNTLSEVRLRDWRDDPRDAGAPPAGDYVVLNSYAYDYAGRMARQTDSMGRRLEYTYYKDDLLEKVVLKDFHDPDGNTRDYVIESNTYDGAGHLTRKVSSNGTVTTENEIDVMGRVKTTTLDPKRISRYTAYTYDAGGNVTRTVQAQNPSNVPWFVLSTGTMVENRYDAAGRRYEERIVDGTKALTKSYTFDQRDLLLSMTDPRGNVAGANKAAYTSTFRHDELGRQVSATGPAVAAESGGAAATTVNPTVTTGYDGFDQPVAVRDPLGNIGRTAYDRLGRPVTSIAPTYTPVGGMPVNPTTHTSYDPLGNVKEVTDPRGNKARYSYDRLNRVVLRDEPAATNNERAVWRYTYTRTGDVLSVTDPMGARAETTYDDLDRPVTSTQFERYPVADALTTTFRYDDAGNLVESVTPGGARTTMSYNGIGQQLSTVDPSGVTTRKGYDQLGNLVRVSDGLGRTSRTDYDLFGRAVAEQDLDSANVPVRAEKFEYDAAGNVIARVNALKKRVTFDYDAANRLLRQVEPKSATETITTTFGYDAAGNRTRYTDGRNNTTLFSVNSLGLPESVVEPPTPAHPAAADRTWAVGYNVSGQAERLTAPGGVVRVRSYDAAGRLTTETGTGAGTPSRGLGYDLAGRVTAVSAIGVTNTYTYNDRGSLLTATGPSGNASYTYDKDGQLTARTDAAGSATFGYTKGRLSTLKDGATAVTQTLGYDAAGQVKTVDYGSGRVRTYEYDNLGRVASDVVRNGAGTDVTKIAYEYDVDDHLIVKDTAGTATPGKNSYGYDDAGRLASWTGPDGKTVEYGWDDSGNRTRAGAKTATYDDRNRLLADSDYTYAYTARGTLASRTSSGLAEEFSFDAFDRLVGQESQTYAYDGLDRVASRNGTPFAYAGFSKEVVADGTESFARGPANELLAVAEGEDKRLALTDEHGDLVGSFDAANTTLAGLNDSTTYDPFGQRTATKGDQSNIGFQGDWTDPDTDQVNMGARWYNPGTGAFNSRDSVTYTAGSSILANRYTYGAGDPLANTDPDGHWPCGWCKSIGKKVNNGLATVGRALGNAGRAVGRGLQHAWNGVKYVASAAWSGVKRLGSVLGTPLRAGLDSLRNGWDSLKRGASQLYDKYAKPYFDKGKEWVQQRAAEIKQKAIQVRDNAKRAISYAAKHTPIGRMVAATIPIIASVGKLVVTAVTQPARVVSALQNVVQDTAKAAQDLYKRAVAAGEAVVNGLSNAMDATAKWIADHKAEIAGFAAGAVVGIGCGVAVGWTGVGAIGCAALAGAVGSLVTDMVEGGKGWQEMGANALMGATIGAVLGPVASVAGSALGAGVRAVAGGAGRQALSVAGSAGAASARSFGSTQLGGLAGRASAGRSVAQAGREAAESCRINSFVPGTAVLMADGTRKRIEDVRVGDWVLASDPTTGRTERKKVTHLIVGWGEKKLVELTIDVDGPRGNRTHAVTATDGHPFWALDLKKWVKAAELRVGGMLQTSAGTKVEVTQVERRSVHHQRVHNLTVDGIHTYYVVAGNTPVLVHNSGGEDDIYPSSREARREAMRRAGIPTSMQPTSQELYSGGYGQGAGRQYVYEVDGKRMLVTDNWNDLNADKPHPPHWEAGEAKPGGQADSLGRERVQSGKSKANYGGC